MDQVGVDERPVEQTPPAPSVEEAEPVLMEDDLLIEDVSIDGMCGVY
ncbi:MAG: mycofactocin precursor MftA [Solirubrobacteraceae bacterium]